MSFQKKCIFDHYFFSVNHIQIYVWEMLLDPNMVLWMNIIDSSVLIIDSNSFVQFQKQSSSKTGSGLLGAFQLVKVKPNYLYC